MKAVTPNQMHEIDSRAINEIGIPGVVLMENAANKVANAVERLIGCLKGKKVLIFAGKGNNGGDAFAIARILHNNGAKTKVYVLADKNDIVKDAAINLRILENIELSVISMKSYLQCELDRISSNAENDIIEADIIIDGIFGTGFRGLIDDERTKRLIEAINAAKAPVIAIDIPSGLNGETGQVGGACIKADATITFTLPKLGLLVHPGCEYIGALEIADIGIPSEVVDSMDLRVEVIDAALVSKIIPQRSNDSNKGDYGKTFIVTGSPGMTGAGCLTARAALRTGAGLVYIGVPSKLSSIYDIAVTEAITVPLADTEDGYLASTCINRIEEQLRHSAVAAIGPGLSTSTHISEVVKAIIKSSAIPLVLDADALNVVAKDVQMLAELKCEAVVTPHPGEMSRLMGISVAEIQHNRISAAHNFAQKWKVITVLKGARTIIALPNGEIFINVTGNPGMATGGTGDVLTGIIAGLISQGIKPSDAVVAAVYIHGLAGDEVARKIGQIGLIAGDLINEVPKIIRILQQQPVNKDLSCIAETTQF